MSGLYPAGVSNEDFHDVGYDVVCANREYEEDWE